MLDLKWITRDYKGLMMKGSVTSKRMNMWKQAYG